MCASNAAQCARLVASCHWLKNLIIIEYYLVPRWKYNKQTCYSMPKSKS